MACLYPQCSHSNGQCDRLCTKSDMSLSVVNDQISQDRCFTSGNDLLKLVFEDDGLSGSLLFSIDFETSGSSSSAESCTTSASPSVLAISPAKTYDNNKY